jgi:hypothetical protein
VFEAAGLAVRAVGSDEDGGGEGVGAIGGGDDELDVVWKLIEGGDGFDLEESGAAAVATGSESLVEAEGVEAGSDGHGCDGSFGADADFFGFVGGGKRGGICGGEAVAGLEDDLGAFAFDNGGDGVAECGEGLAGEPAGAGFGPGEATAVEQENATAYTREVIGGGAAGGSCAEDEGVVVEAHLPEVYSPCMQVSRGNFGGSLEVCTRADITVRDKNPVVAAIVDLSGLQCQMRRRMQRGFFPGDMA